MHLGNLCTALLAWLSVRKQEGVMLLRMEDLDPDRCGERYAVQVAKDLEWLGLDWDEGYGVGGPNGPYIQSQRGEIYASAFRSLEERGLIYPCYCTRAERLAASAPHGTEGEAVYSGLCRRRSGEELAGLADTRSPAYRIQVPSREIFWTDGLHGSCREELSAQCGDFILRRSDGVYAYQLAVTVDDGEAGVTEVVRGMDLLGSAPRQMYLQELFGFEHPAYGHVPMLMAPDGRRLSKRDRDLDLGQLRLRCTPEKLLGVLAYSAGLLEECQSISAKELASVFSWNKLRREDIFLDAASLF